MENNKFNNGMREHVWSIPGLCAEQLGGIERNSRLTITTPEIYDISRIIITGCGDSYSAGLAMKPAMEYLTGLSVEVLNAMELARYTPGELLGRKAGMPLVLAISNSGGVARLAEAVERAGIQGCLTVAITGKPESRLAKLSKKVIAVPIPSFTAGNGVRSYFISMLTLLITSIRIGEVKGRYMMTDSMKYRDAVLEYAGLMEKCIPELDAQMLGIAEKEQKDELFDFIGSGGNYGTAWFSHAKIIEATGEYSIYSDTEAWMHLNCFLKHLDKKFTMIYGALDGADKSRRREVMDTIVEMKEKLYFVTDSVGTEQPDGVELIVLPKCKWEWMWPLFNYLPSALLAGYLCEMKGEAYGRGCRDNWEICGTTKLLTGSKIEII